MCLLAVTTLGNLIGLPAAIVCIGFATYLLVAPAPGDGNRARVSAARFFVYVSLAFVAIWFWMRLALPAGAWMFVIGDRHSWFYDYSPYLAAGIALAVSCVAFLRGMTGLMTPRYIRWLTWVPPLLLLAAAVVFTDEMLSRMEGTTPESAAQHIVNSYPKAPESARLEAYGGPPLFPDSPSKQRTFWIVNRQEKIGVVMVWPNGLFGWKLLRVHWFSDPTDILTDAKVYLKLGDEEKARYCVEQVIRSMPGTPAEREARVLLVTLDRAQMR
jgi:hypothetical protein